MSGIMGSVGKGGGEWHIAFEKQGQSEVQN